MRLRGQVYAVDGLIAVSLALAVAFTGFSYAILSQGGGEDMVERSSDMMLLLCLPDYATGDKGVLEDLDSMMAGAGNASITYNFYRDVGGNITFIYARDYGLASGDSRTVSRGYGAHDGFLYECVLEVGY
jgi:hypothetical protein